MVRRAAWLHCCLAVVVALVASTPAPHAAVRSEALTCAAREKRSTGGEDLLLAPLLLHAAASRGHHSPTFIEIGAFDGEHGSQTFIFERCFDWKGALIEASPDNFEQLQKSSRKVALVHAAVCGEPGGFVNISTGKVSTVAGDTSRMGKTHLRRWAADRPTMVPVPCKPLLNIFDDAMGAKAQGHVGGQTYRKRKPITYLSLDVEGSELEVLKSVPDLQEHPFDVILVENEYNNLRDKLVIELLLSSGYTKMVIPKPTHGGSNDLYVARALVDAAHVLFDNRTDNRHNRHRPVGSYAPHDPVEAMRNRLEKVGVPVTER